MGQVEIMDLKICKDIDILKNATNVVIYGAAEKGREILFKLNDAKIDVDCFCDICEKKWRKLVDGKVVISPLELEKRFNGDTSIYMLACIEKPKELIQLLAETEIKNVKLITYWGITMALYANRECLFSEKTFSAGIMKMEKERSTCMCALAGEEIVRRFVYASSESVWLIQPGKTASTTLEARMSQVGIPYYKAHFLCFPEVGIAHEHRDTWLKKLDESRKEQLKVIVAIREPLSRDYSAFWQAFSKGVERGYILSILDNDFQNTYNEFMDLILKGRSHIEEMLGAATPHVWNDEFEWLDEQIKGGIGIDVFAYPFDKEKGYTIIKQGNVELLLLKVEKLEENIDVISKFVGAESLSSVDANTADEKWYGLAYKEFRKEVKLSTEYVKHYYEGNVKMDHFYTEEEKIMFLEKWKNNIVL